MIGVDIPIQDTLYVELMDFGLSALCDEKDFAHGREGSVHVSGFGARRSNDVDFFWFYV
jgi:serine/threonine protein kinase